MKMRKIGFLLLAVAALWSCQNRNFTIVGTVVDAAFEGTSVYLQETTDDGLHTVATTSVQDGAFRFEGVADANALRIISLGEMPIPGMQVRVPVLLEAGTIEVVFDDVVTTVKGTRLNDALTIYSLQILDLQQRMEVIVRRYSEMSTAGTLTEELGAEMIAEHGQISAEIPLLTFAFIRNNIDNAVGKHVLRASISSLDFEQQEELLALTDDNFRAEPGIARVIVRLENAKRVAIGQRFVDFTMNDPEGNEVSLSDFAGHGDLVLVNFWATWCGPCIRRVPYLVELYSRYGGRGFEIVGVSLDGDHSAWVTGLERHNITWPQMSELKVWNTSVVDLYAFRGIPHTVLLDGEGTIIAKNPSDEELSNKLAELIR
jgi:peroxiredoxin